MMQGRGSPQCLPVPTFRRELPAGDLAPRFPVNCWGDKEGDLVDTIDFDLNIRFPRWRKC